MKKYRSLPVDKARGLEVIRIREYLASRGWIATGSKPGLFQAFEHAGAPGDEVVLPLDNSLGDYARRVIDVVEAVSQLENRTADEVLADIATPASDVIRVRRDDPSTAAGTIYLEDGLLLLTGARKALLSSACIAVEPSVFHRKLMRKEAEELLAASRLGQTERGSFVATLLVPMAYPTAPSSQRVLFDQVKGEPFSRKVTTLLMRGLDQLASAVESSDVTAIMSVPESKLMVSANLCEALLEMRGSGESTALEISMAWSPGHFVSDEIPTKVRLSQGNFERISEIADRLRPAERDRKGQFVGKVAQLAGEEDDEHKMQGPVIFTFQHDDSLLRARLILNVKDYQAACDAHKTAAYVSVRGILRRGDRLHFIEDPSDFKLLDSLFETKA